MRSLVLLVVTTAVVSGLNEITPGFAVDFRSFGGPPAYQEQRLPDRGLARSFRDSQHPLQSFRDETFREYRQPFAGREETRIFHEANHFNGDTRIYKEDNRESSKDELRSFNEEMRPFRDDSRIFKDEAHSFRDDSRQFGEGRPFTDAPRPFYDRPRNFRDERLPIDGRIQYREEIRPYRDEYRTFRDESRPFQDDFRHHENPRNFRNEQKPFRDEKRPFRDEKPCRDETSPAKNGVRQFNEESGLANNGLRPSNDDTAPTKSGSKPFNEESSSLKNEFRPFNEESVPFRNEPRPFREDFGTFRDESRPFKNGPRLYKDESGPLNNEPRPFKDQSGLFRNDPRPYHDESGPLRNEPRPFREESRPFKDEILFTQESQSLAEAHHRYNKDQMHRQPLSFGGHSNYLKFGNHGLGFASVPAAVLPLEDNSGRRATDMTRSEQSSTAGTQSPGTSPSREISDSKNQFPVTQAPKVGSTSSQLPLGNTIDSNTVSNERKNEKLAGEGSTSQASTAVTISTSSGTNVTPKVVFGSGSTSTSNPPMGITRVDGGSGMQQANTAPANVLHAQRQSMHVVPSTNTYSPRDTTPEVPTALLNYIFKYQMPQEAKVRYVYQATQPSENLNHIHTVPLVQHHQTPKYSFLPEFKIPATSSSAIHQPGGTINYVSNTDLPKVSYLNANSAALTLGTNYLTDNAQPVNFAQNIIQLDQGNPFSHLGQGEQLRPIGPIEQFPQIRHLVTSPTYINQLGQYGQFGQTEQPRSNSFNQGGLPLQLGGFGGIDYSALSSNSETSRATPPVSLGIAKVGLSFAEPPRPPAANVYEGFVW